MIKKFNKIYVIISSLLVIAFLIIFFYDKSLLNNIDSNIKIKQIENNDYKIGDNITKTYLVKNNGDKTQSIEILKKEVEKELEIKSLDIAGDKDKNNDTELKPDEKIIITIKGISKINSEDKEEIDIIKNEEIETDETKLKLEEISPSEIKEKIKIKLVNTKTINSNINNLLEFSGDPKYIKYILIGDNYFEPKIDDTTSNFFINIDKKSIIAGVYFIAINKLNGEIQTTEEQIQITGNNDSIFISSITPNIIKPEKNKLIVLQGGGFKKAISVQLNNNIILKNTSFDVINDNVLSINIPDNIPSGVYHFNIMDTQKIYELKGSSINILDN